ncbi:putative glutamine amidotransferase [Salirhabdus euzebyi]|uniref:Putative glutamine amidotransferase n=1 Tax=Salirhabdus euzebyi TaxID=394506 RepID=A0A841Q8H7_9BACI|nr:gamma-glutamyl-gamma-aminobutyrate hydrolase family protein [Salirhabdus euzebyi]MBB6454695.1 putative glutamine amidotransferase [Salirhabdus euzebyi]
MKPLIGITSSLEVDQETALVSYDNINAISKAGGVPIILPNLAIEEDIDQLANKLDGLYVTGGYDIDPTLFGEEPHIGLGTITPARDKYELALLKRFLELDKPILAVCRGLQILNIAAGGNMYQDIYSQISEPLLQHSQNAPKGHASHFVHIHPNTKLYEITGVDKIKVNSRHHQANKYVPNSFQICGEATDGIVEAMESNVHQFVLGLQWHPENLASTGDEVSIKIYEAFLEACTTKVVAPKVY